MTDPQEIVDSLQNQFKSVFSSPSPLFSSNTNFSVPEIKQPLSELSFTTNDIIKAINELKQSSACPKNGIPAYIFKKCKNALALPLKLFWEKSFNAGIIPSDYKLQQIIPLHKKGAKTDAANYRPVSLTSHVIKIFERVLRTKLCEYLEVNGIIKSNQHGFRKNRSCLTQLLSHTNYILELLSKETEVDTIYVDYAKAFDKVDHVILMKKLMLYGIGDKYHTWISNFLQDRKQRVFSNNCYSYETPVISGVPQGSVLGPLLFVLFINDMPEIIQSSILQTFADDTKLAHPISSIADKFSLQKDLNAVIKWSAENNMQLNDKKFELICHRPKTSVPDSIPGFTYAATNNIKIEPTSVVRDLGVLVDTQLSWDSHISHIVNQGRKMSFWILNAFKTRNKETMLLLFNSLIRSRLEYCCELWDRYNIKTISQIEQIQKKFTSKIDGAKDINYWDRLKVFNIFSLQRRRERQRIILIWKIRNGFVPNEIELEFQINIRTSKEIAVVKPMPRIRGKMLSIYEESFSIRSAKLWNKVPSIVQNEASLISFKIKLDNWLSLFPDEPPVLGYYHPTLNSILDHCKSTER